MKLVILDRDGVINQDSDEYVKSVDEWIPLPGSIEAIAKLCHHSFRIAIATNQSGLARGYFDLATLDAMHEKLQQLVEAAGGSIHYLVYCPHGPDDHCHCRKPLPGMFEQIRDAFALADLHEVAVIGDSLRDLEAGMSLGCQPFLVRTGKGERTLAKGNLPAATRVFADLAAAADYLCSQPEPV
ncbi:D-glycero-beta-D-manno-heptose 1,7-bisphosphate 7-phosphatase [Balneatrix alpica]|uniref:D-glycero-beta-D-manno-heptose 1,7-bisphosphate 7-phosphatase n=1 Tax=Balneatrix alpica TaxID=75684 RepID=UPI00273A4648|nr:D-glycero-beta-D-manno-heptose 1,7-bisphosphate 7-phosphatase [Balneatrix alpica]